MSVALMLLAVPAMAQSMNDFRQTGQYTPYNLDFAMQNELVSATENLMEEARAAGATAVALASMPEQADALSLGVGFYGRENSLAIGYTMDNEQGFRFKTNMSYDSANHLSLGSGMSFKF